MQKNVHSIYYKHVGYKHNPFKAQFAYVLV